MNTEKVTRFQLILLNPPLTNGLDNALMSKEGVLYRFERNCLYCSKRGFFFFEFFGVFSENISSVKLFYVTALLINFVFVHIFATAEERHNINSQVKPKHFV